MSSTILGQSEFLRYGQRELASSIVISVFAALSALAVASVAVRVIWLAIRPRSGAAKPREYVFFHSQLGQYAACLLVANFFCAIAGLITLKWNIQGGINQDRACVAQATIMQIGNWGTAFFTVSIAVHTFNSLVLKRRQSAWSPMIVMGIGWTLAIIAAFIPFWTEKGFGQVYGAFGASTRSFGVVCGVRRVYPRTLFFLHLFPIILSSVFGAMLYSLIFLVLRGTLVIKGGLKLNMDPQQRLNASGINADYHRFIASIARSMLWYPVAYIALLLPYSILRMLAISGFTVPYDANVFAYTCWFVLGIVNVLLLYKTFRVLGPAFEARALRSNPDDFDTESFSSAEKPGLGPIGSSNPPGEKIDRNRDQPGGNDLPRHAPPAHLAAVQSFYNYPTSPPVGRNTAPTNGRKLSLLLTSGQGFGGDHSHQSSTNSSSGKSSEDSLGLPAPPRPTRSPIQRYPTLTPATPQGSLHNVDLLGNMPKSAVSRQFSRNAKARTKQHVPSRSQSSNSSGPTSASHTRAPSLSSAPFEVIHRPSDTIPSPIIGPVPSGRQRVVLPAANRGQTNAAGGVARVPVPSFSQRG